MCADSVGAEGLSSHCEIIMLVLSIRQNLPPYFNFNFLHRNAR